MDRLVSVFDQLRIRLCIRCGHIARPELRHRSSITEAWCPENAMSPDGGRRWPNLSFLHAAVGCCHVDVAAHRGAHSEMKTPEPLARSAALQSASGSDFRIVVNREWECITTGNENRIQAQTWQAGVVGPFDLFSHGEFALRPVTMT
jgi:hypothetical protein